MCLETMFEGNETNSISHILSSDNLVYWKSRYGESVSNESLIKTLNELNKTFNDNNKTQLSARFQILKELKESK